MLCHFQRTMIVALLAAWMCVLPSASEAQGAGGDEQVPVTIFPHSPDSRYWLSGQMNFIFQAHPGFPSAYSGPNSLDPNGERATSRVLTLFTGYQLTDTTELFFDVESAGGRGVSDALGLAGFTNLDVVRNPDLGSKPYIARLMLRRIIPLSHEMRDSERTPFSLAKKLPVRRIEIRVGKFGLPDFLDQNSIGSDSHLQFMNWTVDNNGAYDYAADTRGYTYGALFAFEGKQWSTRFVEALMPKVANGIDLDWDLRRARAENVEIEYRLELIKSRASAIRFLTYVNHANMGSYSEAVRAFLAGQDARPTIEAHRQQGRIKYGFGLNAEQELTSAMRVFARWGWDEGENESFAYTEVNETLQAGADHNGARWSRPQDKLGVAFVSNGISAAHQQYLRLGGLGFLLGDGNLDYNRENILESYYTYHAWRGVFGGPDAQYIIHPGYNRARGPVVVFGLRLHVDL